tara:strand:+ start:68 stop:1042 length:975 start_codon:yes stop_codon:yes gene_type:complete
MKQPFTLPILVLTFVAIAAPALAQQLPIAEPDPFGIVGEKEGDSRATDPPAEEKSIGSPEPLDAQISFHILKLAQAEREKRLNFMQIVIDDVVRLCELEEEQRDRLHMAAKGAAERSMKNWHEQAESYFRSRLERTDPDGAKEMLEGMGNLNFGANRSEEEGESLDLWKDAIVTILSEDQIARYDAVLEQRRLDRIEAFSKMSITTLDSHLRLTPKQKNEMSELVHQAAVDYLDDVQRYWGDYFEKSMLMSLANAAEDDALKAVLTEDQFSRLKEATSSFDHFWDSKKRSKKGRDTSDPQSPAIRVGVKIAPAQKLQPATDSPR